jgi:hypothetical protein
MKRCIPLLVLLASACTVTTPPEPPLRDGDYSFTHRFAEHPNMPSIHLLAQIRGRQITFVNNDKADVFPMGVIAQGVLTWHAASRQWIVGTGPESASAPDVGGCSDGPEVVDLEKRIYWTC